METPMAFFEIANEAAFGIGVTESPGINLRLDRQADFPRVDLGQDRNQWVAILSMLFSTWAYYLEGKKIVVCVEEDGKADAWLVGQ